MGRDRSRKLVIWLLALVIMVSGSPLAMTTFAQDATPQAESTPEATGSPVPSDAAYVTSEFVAGSWRIGVVSAERANVFDKFELSARADKDWVVVIADVTNWSRNDERLNPRDFALEIPGPDEPRGFARRSTEGAAAVLGLAPAVVADGVEIDAGDTTRVVLVFEMPIEELNPRLYMNGERLPLDPAISTGPPLDNLPETQPPGETARQEVQAIVSGNTLEIGTDDAATQLAYVDTPLGEECFAVQAESRLRRLATERIILETENDASYFWTEEEDGTRRLLNFEQIGGGYGATTEDLAGRFALWLSSGELDAQNGGGGLWSACSGVHGVERSQEPDRSNIRISDEEGGTTPYRVWLDWKPELVTTPDGGAWAFFSAIADQGPNQDLQRLYASRFDPTTGAWRDAEAMPAGVVQFGASAVADSTGIVHVVYSAREADDEDAWSTLLYTKEDGRGGWESPAPVSLDLKAGHQLAASLAIDANDRLFVSWQDQRAFDDSTRDTSPLNADIFVSNRPATGEWSVPVLISNHFPTAASLLPKLVVDGDRIVAIWSVYTSATGPDNAARMEWTSRDITESEANWEAPMTFANGRGDSFGGRFVDMAADPTGGVVATYARRGVETFLFVKRLLPGQTEWTSDVLIAFGDRGGFPTIAVNNDGVVFVGYNAETGTFDDGSGVLVDVGVSAIDFRSTLPGPEVIVTRDDPNSQGRPVLAVDVTGRPWFVFFGEIPGFVATQVGALRNATIPIQPLGV